MFNRTEAIIVELRFHRRGGFHRIRGWLRRGGPSGRPQPEIIDYRATIRPKHPLPDAAFTPRPYYQVYQQKFGFLPNLSILDLLFNEGNEAVLYL